MSIQCKASRLLRHTWLFVPAMFGYCAVAMASGPAVNRDEHAEHTHHPHMEAQAAASSASDSHANHRQAMEQVGYKRTVVNYALPALHLTTMQGDKISLAQLLDSEQPVVVNFIFTSCTTICPIMSATFAQAQKKLGDEAARIHWVSISIDPEYDTPERLRNYAHRFNAGAHWSFITGSSGDITTLQRAFDVYRGDKMNHIPVTLMRARRDAPWVRLHGLTSGSELVSEYRQATASQ